MSEANNDPSKSPLSWNTLFGWSSVEPSVHTSTSSAAAASTDVEVDVDVDARDAAHVEPTANSNTDLNSPSDRDGGSGSPKLLQQCCFADIDSDDAVEEEMLEYALIKSADKRHRTRRHQQQQDGRRRNSGDGSGRRRSHAGGEGSPQRELFGAAAEQDLGDIQGQQLHVASCGDEATMLRIRRAAAASASATATASEQVTSPTNSIHSARSPTARLGSGRRSNSAHRMRSSSSSSSGGVSLDANAVEGTGTSNVTGDRHVELIRMLRLHVTAATQRELELDGRLQEMGRKCDRLEESLRFIVHSKLRTSHDDSAGLDAGAGALGGATRGSSFANSEMDGEGSRHRRGSSSSSCSSRDRGLLLSPVSCKSSGSSRSRRSSGGGGSGRRHGGAPRKEGEEGDDEEDLEQLYEYASDEDDSEVGSDEEYAAAMGSDGAGRRQSGWSSWKMLSIGLMVQLALLLALIVASKLVVVDLEQAVEGLAPPLGCDGYRPITPVAMSASEPLSGLGTTSEGAAEQGGFAPRDPTGVGAEVVPEVRVDLKGSLNIGRGSAGASGGDDVGPSYRGSLWGAVADAIRRPLRSFSPPRLTS